MGVHQCFIDNFFSIHYLTSIDICNFLVILIDNILIKMDGMGYIKNSISKHLYTDELIFVWFCMYVYTFSQYRRKNKMMFLGEDLISSCDVFMQ